MEITRARTARTLTISQAQYAGKLFEKYCSADDAQQPCDSPLDETVPLTPEQSPAEDSAEYVEMASKRAEYI